MAQSVAKRSSAICNATLLAGSTRSRSASPVLVVTGASWTAAGGSTLKRRAAVRTAGLMRPPQSMTIGADEDATPHPGQHIDSCHRSQRLLRLFRSRRLRAAYWPGRRPDERTATEHGPAGPRAASWSPLARARQRPHHRQVHRVAAGGALDPIEGISATQLCNSAVTQLCNSVV